MKRWVPDRKWWTSGLAGLLTFGLMRFLDIPEGDAGQLAAFSMLLIHYLVPPSVKDKLKRIDDEVRNVVKAGG